MSLLHQRKFQHKCLLKERIWGAFWGMNWDVMSLRWNLNVMKLLDGATFESKKILESLCGLLTIMSCGQTLTSCLNASMTFGMSNLSSLFSSTKPHKYPKTTVKPHEPSPNPLLLNKKVSSLICPPLLMKFQFSFFSRVQLCHQEDFVSVRP